MGGMRPSMADAVGERYWGENRTLSSVIKKLIERKEILPGMKYHEQFGKGFERMRLK